MTQDDIIRMARELAMRYGTRMCDEDGETHGEELYCVGVEDIAEIIKQVAAHEREACAKVCEEPSYMKQRAKTSAECVATIRARGGKLLQTGQENTK